MDALSAMGLDELRAERGAARHELELALMRSRQGRTEEVEFGIDLLRLRARRLTDELIHRYAADLDLVDRLLESTTSPAPRARKLAVS